jgi:hypothetical protein
MESPGGTSLRLTGGFRRWMQLMAEQNAQSLIPVALDDLACEGRLLWCYCLACQYEGEVEPLSLGLGSAEAAPSVRKRLNCSRCGHGKSRQSRSFT